MVRRLSHGIVLAMLGVCTSACVGTATDAIAAEEGGTAPLEETGATETSTPSNDTAITASETAAEDTASPITCGVVACDAAKMHYPKIQAAYDRLKGEPQVGTPKDNGGTEFVHAWGAGKVQDFDGGALGPVVLAQADATEDWAKTGYAVRGKIRETWLALGGAPMLGYPKEDEHAGPGGQVQQFEKGCIAPDGSGKWASFTTCEAPPDLQPTLDAIGKQVPMVATGTDIVIAVTWLPTGDRWSFRGDVTRTSASSAKWFWAAAALNKTTIAAVEPPALPTFKDSNNSTAGQLIDLAGGPNAVNDFTSKTLGIPITQISLCGWSFDKTRRATNCSNAHGGDNFFTAIGAVTFLEKIWKRDPIAGAEGDKLLEWAKLSPRTGYGGWIGTQLPTAARTSMHHKAGWLPTGCCSAGYPPYYNEIGIVHTPRGSYAAVFGMKNGTDSKMIKALEWSSCVVYHALAKDAADPFKAGCTSP